MDMSANEEVQKVQRQPRSAQSQSHLFLRPAVAASAPVVRLIRPKNQPYLGDMVERIHTGMYNVRADMKECQRAWPSLALHRIPCHPL